MIDESLRQQYERRRPAYEKLVQEVKFALERSLDHRHMKVAAVVGRAKDVNSFLEKIERKRYDLPFEQIDDLAGVRVICLFEPDLDKVHGIIKQLFDVVRSDDKMDLLGLDRMGYRGHHYVILLSSSSYMGPRYEGLHDLRCEIQVRTILQDAWAQLSHNLVYKSEASIPTTIRRQLNNVSSLLEIAQNVFDDVNQTRDLYVKEIERTQADEEKFLAQPINHETLSAYTSWKFPDLPVNVKLQEMLIRDLDHYHFKALKDIDRAVVAASRAVECYRRENPEWFKAGTDFITKSIGFVDKVFREKHPFASRTREAFRRYSGKVAKSEEI